MGRSYKGKAKSASLSQVLPMVLIGAGLVIFGVLVFLLLPKPEARSAGFASGGDSPSALPVSVEFAAPEVVLKDLQGNPVSLNDFLGEVVLVNNWATWCPPCKAEMPTLQAFFDAHSDQRFTVIGIEAGEPAVQVAEYVQEVGLTFPIWIDMNQKALIAFQNNNLPSSYVIDRLGTVRLAWTGAINRETLEEYVTPIIEE